MIMLSLDYCDAIGLEFGRAQKLAAANDSGESFEQIADYIEEKL
jgi:hypothetical protein